MLGVVGPGGLHCKNCFQLSSALMKIKAAVSRAAINACGRSAGGAHQVATVATGKTGFKGFVLATLVERTELPLGAGRRDGFAVGLDAAGFSWLYAFAPDGFWGSST